MARGRQAREVARALAPTGRHRRLPPPVTELPTEVTGQPRGVIVQTAN
ncbi:hypothetical protein [Micromonospora sp. KC207]|nr:hypothetical protein [Micromonospora sp. KC207]